MSDLSRKLQELRDLAARERVDIAAEIEALSRKIGDAPSTDGDAWRRVELARHPDRPTTLEYAQRIFDDFIELHGDRGFGDDSALVGGIGLLAGRPVTFFGHQKGRNMKDNMRRNFGMPHPEGYRKAQRLARQAEKFDRPVLSFIDTPGAFPGVASEERGISQAIAESMKLFAGLRVPVVATVLGEGGSGGAIAIGVADTILIMENAYYSVITPEGCASILLRDASKAPESAALLEADAEGPARLQGGRPHHRGAQRRRAQGSRPGGGLAEDGDRREPRCPVAEAARRAARAAAGPVPGARRVQRAGSRRATQRAAVDQGLVLASSRP